MSRYLITYGDNKFEAAKKRFIRKAKDLNLFDHIIAYSEKDLSDELKHSEVIKEKRGGGLWSWKSDIIHTTLNHVKDGDIIVYCDAGCSLYKSKEWEHFWILLKNHDIVAQRIYQRTDKWTRRNVINYFNSTNANQWTKCYQFLATIIILKATPFTRKIISEWRTLMIEHPEMAKDITEEERKFESCCFIENRHDQAIYSSLIYEYLNDKEYKSKIKTQWEHIEDYDIIFKQAIRATRLRNGNIAESTKRKIKAIFKRLIKDYILRPFYYMPLQWYYSK